MPKVTVDFSEVQDFDALPEDEYGAIIEKATWVEAASDDKHDYINLQFDVTEPEEFKGRKAFTILSLSPKALFRMKDTFENLGIVGEDEEIELDYDEDTMALIEPELAGLPCRITLGIRTYEGKEQNEVKVITSADGPGVGEKKTAPKKTPAKKSAAKTTPAAKKPAARKFK